ncbi:hypothetical protein D5301_14625 [Stenotrophomonas sp. MH181796]|uniref:hypothetical protein n=1 Tax=Stenotrophomonas sp. MH181796 TaxID=2339228 RepID=UPI00129CB52A|nr:hypothetical protein [Stenotrophomonas sp. MH181796]MRI43462.1 hypothetical protein [Stenotrophomonas sp. MH181796]
MDEIDDQASPIRLRLCALMLQYFQTPRPGFRISRMRLSEYSTDDIREVFHQLRRHRWLEATVAFDIEGNRFEGLVISLTPWGRAAARALLAEIATDADAACQKGLLE